MNNDAYRWLKDWVEHGGYWDNDTFGGLWDLSLYGWQTNPYDILNFREQMEELLEVVERGMSEHKTPGHEQSGIVADVTGQDDTHARTANPAYIQMAFKEMREFNVEDTYTSSL